ncbi:GATA-type transcription factor ASCRUDRAFT_122370 [Ascoidea rubescens DSM 1968]|uniref:GATA-type domain-containing protein n=1 Tax=Ascoidea rubescens DSM 1968 TaxID=1344418 RepID=A0A1D2VA36_9ASCO|nr:hypothetical protein ASCRUDRAFT_122370 [Ascoidea rubescens DSM 1968]ODV58327.1 hypothetical protein ASCRUDRAFT_122370 [Ascoidea rubescens DSM 1968]
MSLSSSNSDTVPSNDNNITHPTSDIGNENPDNKPSSPSFSSSMDKSKPHFPQLAVLLPTPENSPRYLSSELPISDSALPSYQTIREQFDTSYIHYKHRVNPIPSAALAVSRLKVQPDSSYGSSEISAARTLCDINRTVLFNLAPSGKNESEFQNNSNKPDSSDTLDSLVISTKSVENPISIQNLLNPTDEPPKFKSIILTGSSSPLDLSDLDKALFNSNESDSSSTSIDERVGSSNLLLNKDAVSNEPIPNSLNSGNNTSKKTAESEKDAAFSAERILLHDKENGEILKVADIDDKASYDHYVKTLNPGFVFLTKNSKYKKNDNVKSPKESTGSPKPDHTPCTHCNAMLSPEWRSGPAPAREKKAFCNACGLFYKKLKKYGRTRKDMIMKARKALRQDEAQTYYGFTAEERLKARQENDEIRKIASPLSVFKWYVFYQILFRDQPVYSDPYYPAEMPKSREAALQQIEAADKKAAADEVLEFLRKADEHDINEVKEAMEANEQLSSDGIALKKIKTCKGSKTTKNTKNTRNKK